VQGINDFVASDTLLSGNSSAVGFIFLLSNDESFTHLVVCGILSIRIVICNNLDFRIFDHESIGVFVALARVNTCMCKYHWSKKSTSRSDARMQIGFGQERLSKYSRRQSLLEA